MSNIKKNKIVKGFIFVIVLVIAIGLCNYVSEKRFSEPMKIIADQMDKLDCINNTFEYTNNKIKYVEGFDVEKDTFQFKNFGSSTSNGGNCEGFSFIELINYNKKLEDKIDKNLSEYHLNQNDIKVVYGENEDKEYCGEIADDNNKWEYNDKKNNEELIKKATGKKSIDKNSQDKYFDEVGLENKEMNDILDLISKAHKDKNYTRLESDSYYDSDIDSIEDIKDMTRCKTISPSLMIDKINDNQLVEVSISNDCWGHALLIYGYEIIDNNNIKFYVKDSNIPINKKQTKQINDEIKKKDYILFTKEVLKDDWSYIYNPNINGKKVYHNKYNSFLPGTKFGIYGL